LILFCTTYIVSKWTDKNRRLSCPDCLFIGLLPSNGCISFVESVTSIMCLPRHCLATGLYVTILTLNITEVRLENVNWLEEARNWIKRDLGFLHTLNF
jgi:hypothetical protein